MTDHIYKLEATCFPVAGSKPIYLSSYYLAQPFATDHRAQYRHGKFLDERNVGAIMNVTIDSLALRPHREWYDEMDYQYLEIPIADDPEKGLPRGYLDQCVNSYLQRENPDKNVLVHCCAGINRSSCAVGAILWVVTHEDGSRPWKTPEEMIKWMRECQKRDRQTDLLTNLRFFDDLVKWCLHNEFVA